MAPVTFKALKTVKRKSVEFIYILKGNDVIFNCITLIVVVIIVYNNYYNNYYYYYYFIMIIYLNMNIYYFF